MARADTHTRIVGWLKVVLPLAALAILSTLFLLAEKIDPQDALPYAEVDVEDLAREPRMTLPSYAGMTSDGATLSLSAKAALPGTDEKPAQALDVHLSLATPDGAETELTAASATLDKDGKVLRLSGGVQLSTGHGYSLETPDVTATLDRSGLEATSGITVKGPIGSLSADEMTLSQDLRIPETYLMVFKGKVRLVYIPGQ